MDVAPFGKENGCSLGSIRVTHEGRGTRPKERLVFEFDAEVVKRWRWWGVGSKKNMGVGILAQVLGCGGWLGWVIEGVKSIKWWWLTRGSNFEWGHQNLKT